MNAEYGDITRTRPEDLRVNTSGVAAATAIVPSIIWTRVFPSGPNNSAGCQLIISHLITCQGQQTAAQHALAIFTARVYGSGSADFDHTGRFMNMAVQAKQRLMQFDCPAHRLAAGSMKNDLTPFDDLGRRI